MLHKMSLDVNSKCKNRCVQIYFEWRAKISTIPHSCCLFNKIFLVNHWRDNLNCSVNAPSLLPVR